MLLFSLIAFFGWGTGDICSALSARTIGFRLTLFFFLLLSFITGLVYLPFAQPVSDWSLFPIALFLGCIHVLGSFAFFKSFETGNVSLAGTVAGSFPLVVVAISLLFFHERLSFYQVTGIGAIFLGLVLISLKPQTLKMLGNTIKIIDKPIIYALIAMVCWGVYFGFVKIPSAGMGWFWAGYVENLLLPVLLISGAIRKDLGKLIKRKNRNWIIYILGLVILARLGDFAYNIAILKGDTSISAPIAGSYPVLFVILTRIFFKEPLEKWQKWGIASTLAGIVMVNIST